MTLDFAYTRKPIVQDKNVLNCQIDLHYIYKCNSAGKQRWVK